MNAPLLRDRRLPLLLLVLCATLIGAAPGHGAEAPAEPPYLTAGTHHLVIDVVWDPEIVRKALPSWIEPSAGMTGAINIYQVERGYGITPYQAVYFWVDVEGFDSPSGIKGRWMLAGVYGPDDRTSAAFREHYQLPVRRGSSRTESTADGLRAVGTVGETDFVTAAVKSSPKPCQAGAAMLSYPSPKGLIEIPFVGEFCEVELLALDIAAPPGDPFAELEPVKVLGATEIRNGAFSLSRAVPFSSPAH